MPRDVHVRASGKLFPLLRYPLLAATRRPKALLDVSRDGTKRRNGLRFGRNARTHVSSSRAVLRGRVRVRLGTMGRPMKPVKAPSNQGGQLDNGLKKNPKNYFHSFKSRKRKIAMNAHIIFWESSVIYASTD